MKRLRQSVILDLVGGQAISSQEALRRRLRTRGFDATQATISRDIKELGLVKRAVDGAYEKPLHAPTKTAGAEATLRRAVSEYLRGFDRVQQLVVLKTDAGQASLVALAIDHAAPPEVIGTVAGDDTILAIARDARCAKAFMRRLEQWAKH